MDIVFSYPSARSSRTNTPSANTISHPISIFFTTKKEEWGNKRNKYPHINPFDFNKIIRLWST